MSGSPKVIAEGRLDATPLAHVLLSLHAKSMSGTLAIWPADGRSGQDRLLIERGRVVAVRPLDAAGSLERSLMPLFSRAEGVYAFYMEDLVGAGEGVLRGSADPLALVAASLRGGAPEAALQRVLAGYRDQRVRLKRSPALSRLGLNKTEEAFLELMRTGPDTVQGFIESSGQPVRAERLLYLLAITQHLEVAPTIGAESRSTTAPPLPPLPSPPPPAFAPATSTPPHRSSVAASAPAPSIPAAEASSTARTTSVPRRSNTPARMPSTTPAKIRFSEPPPPPAHIRSSAPRSDATGAHRALGTSRRPRRTTLNPESLGPPPPDALSGADRARWHEVAERAALIEDETYYDMLGVDSQADSKAVDAAYFAAVKIWHPDRLPASLEPVKEKAQRIFRYLTEARETLNDPKKRIRYREAVEDGGGTPAHERKMNILVTAAMEFQKVEVLVRRNAWREALPILEELIGLAPEEADYHAMMGWVLFQLHGATGPELEAIRKAVDAALKQDADHVRALYLKGLLLKNGGKTKEAVACFRRVVELQPSHVDATREVRLAELRKGQSGHGGFLGKLFGRK